jgi:DNA-binding transcriptional regulator YiaG
MLGISRRTLENWEALRREPDGPARVLLAVAKYQPKAIVKALEFATGGG